MKGCKNAKNNDLQLLLFPSNQSRKEKQHTSPSFILLTASCAASSCQFGCYDMEAEALIGRAGRGTRHVSIHICFFVCATKRRLRNETAHVPVDALSTPCCAASSPPDAVVRCAASHVNFDVKTWSARHVSQFRAFNCIEGNGTRSSCRLH